MLPLPISIEPYLAEYFTAKYSPGNFLLQLCTPGDVAYTVHLHTPIFCGS